MKTRTRILLLAAGVAAVGVAGWAILPRPTPPVPEGEVLEAGTVRFEDVAARVGVTFRHFDPATPQHLIPETMGCGIAWIDYDADGWPDLFCVQAGPLPPAAADPTKTHKLYHNNRDGTFTDVTDAVGLGQATFGTGCAVGDFDNDGFDDLLVTSLGGLTLFRNVSDPSAPGGRRFVDVTVAAGLAGTDPHYATSCAWGDLDGDGFLDLYVCNYVELDPDHPQACRDANGVAQSCPPTSYPLTTHRLYRNRRDGTFEDVTAGSGVGKAKPAAGLAVVIVDLDGDGRPDVYVANDLFAAHLFHNQTPRGGPITLVERATLAGCGLAGNGDRMSGMCAEAADVDGSGRPALFVTDFQYKPNRLFRNLGGLRFVEVAAAAGLAGPSRSRLGFGACFLDADLDGNLDLVVANGHVYRSAEAIQHVPYAQEAQLFLGDGRGKFRDVSRTAGPDFLAPRVGRGVARCDFDNDGRPDVCMSAVGGHVALFRNMTDTANGWIGLDLVGDGKTSNRNAIGAVVTVESGGQPRTYFVVGGGSYLSASDRRLTIGLGAATGADRVVVRWPSGREQEFRGLAGGRYWRLRDGRGDPEPLR
jgi:hypothetical protein